MRYSYTYNNAGTNENLLFSENKTITKKQNTILLYEKANHLGNVLVVFTDKKIPVTTNGTTIDHFDVDVENTFDYTPFGAPMNERSYRLIMKKGSTYVTNPNDKFPAFVNGNEPVANIASESVKYRYGYQGSEKDDEVNKGSGGSYTTEYRILDTRLARWLSTDPMYSSNSWQSPYISMDNSPILLTDIQGNTVDVTKLDEKDKASLKGDLESKTGFKLKEVKNELGDVHWEVDKSKGVVKDGTSGLARRELKKAIRKSDVITLESSKAVDYAQTLGGERGNTILWNASDIENIMKNTSEGLDPTTMGFALTFFHEIQHTKAFALNGEQSEDPPNYKNWSPEKSLIDFKTNRIRRQLGTNYGKREHYYGQIIYSAGEVEGGLKRAFIAMDKQSLKDLMKGQVPTGKNIEFHVKGK